MNKKTYYKKIFGYFKKELKLIIIYTILALLLVGFSTVIPILSAKVLAAITSVNLKDMFKFSLIILIIDIVEEFIHVFSQLSSRKIQDNVELKIKEDVSKELFELEIKNFDKEGTGFFANRIEREPGVLASIFSRIRYNLTSCLSSLGIYIYLFVINYKLALFLLISSLIQFLFYAKRTKIWEEERKKSEEFSEKYLSNFSELIRGIKDIKVLNLKKYLINKTVKEQKEIIDFNYKSRGNDEKYFLIERIIRTVIDFVLIVLGILLIKNGELSGANFLIIYMYKGRAVYFIDNINYFYRNIKEFNISLERLYEVVDGKKYPKEKFGSMRLDNLKGNIEFKNVTFGYGDEFVLKGITFKIKKNETIGIVGKSGAGKTTIFNLINKLYNVDDNSIFFDGVDINKLSEGTIRENISTITQNPYIFNVSIKDNLKMVKPSISDKEMIDKCKECVLDKYVNSLEKGYDTLVGENGVILSGGLKQRLAIARALIKDSKIILLDEATSSLDNETQDYIHDSIKKIRKDYTILIIAHRLSTVIDCDKILVIDDGKVVGFDTHENLIQNNKYYKKLYKKELIN